MDLVLSLADTFLLDKVWSTLASAWERDHISRQLISLTVITLIGIHFLYFLFAGLSYSFIFNHAMMRHPRFLPHQIRLEILTSLKAFPVMTLLTLPWFFAEVRGYSRLYDGVSTYGWFYLFASVPLLVFFSLSLSLGKTHGLSFGGVSFLVFTDYCIYWIHRWLHIPFLYKLLHKPHHKWLGKEMKIMLPYPIFF
jgi:lathosterol oxidase